MFRMLPLATMMDPVSDTVYSSSHSATDINLDVATSQPMKSVSLFMLLNYHSSAHLCWVWSAIMRWVCLFFCFFPLHLSLTLQSVHWIWHSTSNQLLPVSACSGCQQRTLNLILFVSEISFVVSVLLGSILVRNSDKYRIRLLSGSPL